MEQRPRRILVVRLSALGDVVNCLPALTALRQQCPHDYIAWACEEGPSGILREHPYLDELIVVPLKRWRRQIWSSPLSTLAEAKGLFARLRAPGFDVVLDFHGNLKSGVVGRLSGAPHRVGYHRSACKEWNHRFTNHWVEPPRPEGNRVERYLSLLEGLSLDVSFRRGLIPQRPEDQRAAAAAIPSRARGPVVILHPGTSARAAFKQWPVEHFGDLARRLTEDCGAEVLVTQGPDERDLAKGLCRHSRGTATLCPLLPSLGALAALIENSSLLVAADTGILHLAACVGTPVIGLYGPKDPTVYAPYGAPSEVVTAAVDCAPCKRRDCADPVCMRSIDVTTVLEAARRLLEASHA